jgi:spermidine/putrescine transport system substrate-binding protein
MEARYGRRQFLQRTAAGAFALSSMSTLLAACGGGNGSLKPPTITLARQDNPVKWPIFPGNEAIASGLEPENGPLRIYNWNSYLWPRSMKEFGKQYGVDVNMTTFDTSDEAISKLTSGGLSFDVFFPFPDRLGQLILGKALQPLNHSYLPNLQKTIWPSLRSPFYDVGSQYTVPYTIYTTGIGYRTDQVQQTPGEFQNPYDIYWDTRNKGKTFLLDDGREAPIHMLLKNGITDINTEKPADIALFLKELKSLIGPVHVKLSTNDYTNIAQGIASVHQAWSGSMVSAKWYLPQGTGTDVLGYWFPADGHGTIGNDMMGVPRSATNPVLAHHFINFMLEDKNGYDNFAQFNGYQPPFVTINPNRLIADGVIPKNLTSAVVRESDFERAYFLLELSPAGQAAWQNAWADFKAGV